MTGMKKLIKKLDDVLSAAAFAEEGEFETAREIMNEPRTILLALTGKKSDEDAFKYSVNICKRIGAGLEILYVAEPEKAVLNKFKNELKKEGVNYAITKRSGCVKEEIIDYTEKRKDIQFVVVESSDILDVDCSRNDKKLSDAWENLKCPLVLVSKGGLPSPA